MASLFDKIFTQVRGTLHDTIDNNSNPGTTARQLIRDLEEKISKAEDGLVDAKANEKVIESNVAKAQADYDKYDGYARKALAQNNESLAKDALTERVKAESTLKTYKDQLAAFSPTVDALEAQVSALRAKKDELQRKSEMLEAQGNAAAAQDKVATALTGIGDTNSIEAQFAEMEKRTEKKTLTAQAKMEAAGLHKPIDDKFKALDAAAPSSIDDELARMKAEMNK